MSRTIIIRLLISIFFLQITLITSAQVAINTDGSTPHPSAILDVKASDKGILIPRMTEAERDAIASPVTALLIYQTDGVKGFYYYHGSSWDHIEDGTSSVTELDDLGDGSYDGESLFLGESAGTNDDGTLNRNVGIGKQALYNNVTGFGNTATGYLALYDNVSGASNTATGYLALYYNTGSYNTATGYKSLYANTSGSYNTAVGHNSLYTNTSGNYNTAVGHESLASNIAGTENTGMGYRALTENTSGDHNTALGYFALFDNTTGDNNTGIGYYALSTGALHSNSSALGYNAEPNASNTIRLGNSSVSTIGGYADWTNVSDGRFKVDVAENVVGLDFVMKLRPVTYHLDMDAIARFNQTPDSLRLKDSEALKAAELQSGFIAQEVEQAATELGYDFHGVDKPKNENAHYGLRYATFVVPMVKAIQEQQKMIETLISQNEKLQIQLNKLTTTKE